MSAGGPDRAPIPYGRHDIDEDDVAAVIEVLRHGWLTQGPEVAAFETDLATRCGARHAVAVSSGTAALHLAILAARVGEGDELVAPAVSFLATANCGVYTGAEPRFSDVDPDLNGDVNLLLTELPIAGSIRIEYELYYGQEYDYVAKDDGSGNIILEGGSTGTVNYGTGEIVFNPGVTITVATPVYVWVTGS